jgi:hypothetical protein
VTCTPASGANFPKGTTTVNCMVRDASNNQGTGSFTVTVNDTQNPMISCSGNLSVAAAAGQCSAVVNYATPTASDNCSGVGAVACNPASGTSFAKGVTTVSCTVKDASNNQATCTFTVTVNDTQAPQVVCPANQTRVTARPGDTSVVVSYPAPTVTDNCSGATVACLPPTGATFTVGVTIVTCTATDSAGNTAVCSFMVSVFDGCLQDESIPTMVLLFNTQTGDYRFCCSGSVFTGKGTVVKQGSVWTLTHNAADRRVNATLDGSTNRGNASLQSPAGTTRCTITDRDIRNNACTCQ